MTLKAIQINCTDDGQCGQEGFEIAIHGHVSFGERSDMAVDSRRNLLARPGMRDQ